MPSVLPPSTVVTLFFVPIETIFLGVQSDFETLLLAAIVPIASSVVAFASFFTRASANVWGDMVRSDDNFSGDPRVGDI